ncbi:MAG TPA: acyl-CoA dehydrogenase family protein [Solirubrobacteraceae bacterium]|nr:acyl-CoA dehydrogenase family protein [Solirubrobacteraceae bacterium]
MASTGSRALALEGALEQISARAHALDAEPRFPRENLDDLQAVGALAPTALQEHSLREEIGLVRAVARVDASTARILDGHLNGVERVALSAPAALREAELSAITAGRLLLGVWGADPAPGEGEPAHVIRAADGSLVLCGVKTFCSGAGGVQRALVVVNDEHQRRRLAYIDAHSGLLIDRNWYRASGLRASESHRVEFDSTPVLALLGDENELLRQPYFARDAVRTAATWAGIADGIVAAAIAALRERSLDDSQLAAVGRMSAAQGTVDRWLAFAGARLDASIDVADEQQPDETFDAQRLAHECRAELTSACRVISDQAAQACGSRSLVDGSALDRGRRDLDLFLLQHRLTPQLTRLGRLRVEAEDSSPPEDHSPLEDHSPPEDSSPPDGSAAG